MTPQRVEDLPPTQFRNSEDPGLENILTPLTVQQENHDDVRAGEEDKNDDQKEELTPLRTMMEDEEKDDNLNSFRNILTKTYLFNLNSIQFKL